MDKQTRSTHPSFGLIGVSRVTSSRGETMFGSSIKHGSFMKLTIKRAEHVRSLATDWYHGREVLAEVYLSPTQFAEMITALNVGDGVPCTIRQTVNEHNIGEPPFEGKGTIASQEFQDAVNEVVNDKTLYYAEAMEILNSGKPIGKKDRETIAKAFQYQKAGLTGTIPFLETQFTKQIDKTVLEAKGAVEAFVEHKIRQTGIEAIRHEVKLIGDGESPGVTE